MIKFNLEKEDGFNQVRLIYLFISLLLLVQACGVILNKKVLPSNLSPTENDGKRIIFVGTNRPSLKTWDVSSKRGWIMFPREDFVGKTATIKGKIEIDGNEYYIVELDGSLKRVSANTLIYSTVFVDELDRIKTELVGKTIWLGKPKDVFGTQNILTKLDDKELSPKQKSPFHRFQEVEVVDIIPYNQGGVKPQFYLKIKTYNNIGYIDYSNEDYKRFRRKYQRYYTSNPIKENWSNQIVSMILNGGINLYMTAEQVRLSWGEPTMIHTVTTKSVKDERWVYGKYGNSYIYFEDGVVVDVGE